MHNYLLDIYTSHLPNDEKRDYHKEFLDKNIKGERIIITGLIGSDTKACRGLLCSGNLTPAV